ncbi:hypothetical protein B0T24DRAFT_674498 [Lasiosphaeria ovina]|uniref:F-box domain-containing protein n=1 Tax=Lasiosphaeria ovina TaxID=92902 RepID=A0AAE0KKY5_9PEZI|nr:hypothetical protein B0T24DRAFT_674498 [Lasiosphaeria ovina]
MLPVCLRSEVEYGVGPNPDKRDAVIRAATYRRPEYDNAGISFSPSTLEAVRSSLRLQFPPVQQQRGSSFSMLESLPLELLCDVFTSLDIEAILNLRQVSHRLREAVGAVPAYEFATEHGLDAVLALFWSGLGPHFTLHDVNNALRTEYCAVPRCGRFGHFVFLPTLNRVCFECLGHERQFSLLLLSKADIAESHSSEKSEPVHVMHTLPGFYSERKRKYHKQRHHIVAELDSVKPRDPGRGHYGWPCSNRYLAAIALPFLECSGSQVRSHHTVFCKGCVFARDNKLGPTGRARWLHGRTKTLPLLVNRMYDHRTYFEHFKWCRQAQILWDSGKEIDSLSS